MKINFTKKQYKILNKLLYIGSYIYQEHIPEDEYEEIEALEDYVLSYTKEFGFEDHTIKDNNKYYLDKNMEDDIHQILDEYDNKCFWDLLVTRMIHKELETKYSSEKLENMPLEEKINIIMPLEEKYETEFSNNGLKNLIL
jgi:hypothetical protein